MRVLLIEDEPTTAKAIELMLTTEGFNVYSTDLGEEGLDLGKLYDYDIILLDRMMPGLDGIGLLQRIKADHRFAHIPVIMQTAAGEPDQIREGMQAGAYYYLTKPYRGETLLAIVQAASESLRSRNVVHEKFTACIDSLHFLQQGEFTVRSIDEANQLAVLIAQTFPNPDSAGIGISELLVNAVEHGNLGLSYEEKTQLKLADRWREEIDRRAALPEYADRLVRVCFTRNPQGIRLKIYDQGQGFPWENFLELSAERACDPNGRGIALAKMMSFSRITYEGCGNIAIAEVDFQETTSA